MIMKDYAVFGVALFALAACGNSDRSKFVNACVEEGQDRKQCSCFADVAKDGLSPKAFSVLANASTMKDTNVLNDLDPEDAVKFVGVVLQAAQKCEITDFGGL